MTRPSDTEKQVSRIPDAWETANVERMLQDIPQSDAAFPDSLSVALSRQRNGRIFAGIVIAVLFASLLALVVLLVQGNMRVAVSQESNMVLLEDEDSKMLRKTTDEVQLPELLGMDRQRALKKCGHSVDLDECRVIDDDGAIYRYAYVLADEKVSVRDGAIYLYLDVDSRDMVVAAGYRSPFSNLGFGSYSFTEAVGEARVIQEVFADMNIKVNDADVSLPDDLSQFTEYESDGVTAIARHGEFSGRAQNKPDLHWDAVLDFDYSEANEKRNHAYTRRYVEVWVACR